MKILILEKLLLFPKKYAKFLGNSSKPRRQSLKPIRIIYWFFFRFTIAMNRSLPSVYRIL